MGPVTSVIEEFARYIGLKEGIDYSENPICFYIRGEGTLFIEPKEEDILVYFFPEIRYNLTSSHMVSSLKNNYYKKGINFNLYIGLSKDDKLIFCVKLKPEEFTFQRLDEILSFFLEYKNLLDI